MEKITQSKEQIDRIEFHKALCDGLHRLYLDKNSDYGDSFRKVREELPWAILVRLSDKLNRLKSLIPKDSEPRVNESIDDTLMDIANYALLELVERGVGKTELAEEQMEIVNNQPLFYQSGELYTQYNGGSEC